MLLGDNFGRMTTRAIIAGLLAVFLDVVFVAFAALPETSALWLAGSPSSCATSPRNNPPDDLMRGA
jgi:hypothetical protein